MQAEDRYNEALFSEIIYEAAIGEHLLLESRLQNLRKARSVKTIPYESILKQQ